MHDMTTQVAVVGGGPGGSTTAALLARSGHDVLLLERETHPRHQIGESLLPSTIHGVCPLLGVSEQIEAAGFVPKHGGTLRWGKSPEPWTFTFAAVTRADKAYAFQVERAKFDQILFENARTHGVRTCEGVEARELVFDGDRVAGVRARNGDGQEFTVRADFVVDASGHGSRLARHVGPRVYSEFFRSVAVYGYFSGAERQPPPREGNIVVSAFDKGWCWLIPLGDDLTSVGAVVDRTRASSIGRNRADALLAFAREAPIVGDMLRGASPIEDGMYGEVRVRKDWSYLTERLSAPGIVLVGDAACFVDPTFSSGVHLATYGGVLAARTVTTALAGEIGEVECRDEFERRYRAEFRSWYEFLVGFFDMEGEWADYFWHAKRVLNTQERANDAFVRLVAGAGATGDELMAICADTASQLAALFGGHSDDGHGSSPPGRSSPPPGHDLPIDMDARIDAVLAPDRRPPSGPEGLAPSDDGLRWVRGADADPRAPTTTVDAA